MLDEWKATLLARETAVLSRDDRMAVDARLCGDPATTSTLPTDTAPPPSTTVRGLCAACNYAKQAPGWEAKPEPAQPGRRHTFHITTPTGHTHHSTAPPLPTPFEGVDDDRG